MGFLCKEPTPYFYDAEEGCYVGLLFSKTGDIKAFFYLDETHWTLIKNLRLSLSGTGYAEYNTWFGRGLLHRLLHSGDIIDHINGNKLDNRSKNLRTVTTRQNTINRKTRNKNGVTGVHWCHQSKPWQAQARINGKKKTLGYFNTPEEAHEVYKLAKLEDRDHKYMRGFDGKIITD